MTRNQKRKRRKLQRAVRRFLASNPGIANLELRPPQAFVGASLPELLGMRDR